MVMSPGSPIARFSHNLRGGGISEKVFGDFSAAEHRYLERRQWEISNQIQIQNGQKLDRINAEISHLNAQTAQANQIALAQLEQQRAQLELQIEEAERTAAQRIKEDHRAFASWRQTPEGQYFVAWCNQAGAVMRFVNHFDQKFKDALWALIDDTVTREDIESADSGQWVPHSDDYRRGRILVFLGAGLSVLTFFMASASQAMTPFFLGSLGLTYYGHTLKKKETGWEQRNEEAREAVRQRHVAILGFDPLIPGPLPAIFPDEAFDYIDALNNAANQGFEYHSPPSALPPISLPEFTPRTELSSPRLLEVYDQCLAEREELTRGHE